MYDQFGRYVPDYGFQRPQQMQPMQPMSQHMEVVRINGRGGAEAFQMAPNSSALLLDTTQAVVWLKTTDGAGYPTLAPYTITPMEEQPPVSTGDIIKRIERLEAMMDGRQSDAGST